MARTAPAAAGGAGGDDEGSSSQQLQQQETEAALHEYAAFRQRLQGDLDLCRLLRGKLEAEERQYAELEANIALLQREKLSSLTTLVPLGAGCHAQAAVANTSRIYVHIALGFHPELTLEEAAQASALRRQHLQRQIDARTREAAGIRAHIRLVEQALTDLRGLALGGTAGSSAQ